MKSKTILLCFAIISITTFSSCKKDWNCQCVTGSITTNTEIKDETLLNARSKCASMGGSAGGVTTTCSLQ